MHPNQQRWVSVLLVLVFAAGALLLALWLALHLDPSLGGWVR